MKKISSFIYLPLALIALNLSACGYIKGLFPDKEKDYQYTTEIPALVLPPDLGRQDILKPPPATKAASVVPEASPAPAPIAEHAATENIAFNTAPVADHQVIAPAPDTEPAQLETVSAPPTTPNPDQKSATKHEFIPIEMINAADGNKRLRLGVPFEKAWRLVDKALSRKSIEVTGRNKQEQRFNLHYDPNEKKLQDGSLWDEALFIFSGFQGDEKEFVVKLTDSSTGNTQTTDVVVLDNAQQASTDAAASNLLNLLQDTIQTDFAK